MQDRVVIVVGAGQSEGATIGNGRAAAVTYAREGAKMVLVDRDPESLAVTAEMCRDVAGQEADLPVQVVADVTADDTPARVIGDAVAAFGGLDVLHNNVGVGAGDGPPHRLDDDGFDRIMDINLRSVWRMCREAVPELRRSDHGAIVNISSLAAIAAANNLTAYKLSKAALNALTQNLALTNARYGVRANAIMPGFIDTPMGVDAQARHSGQDRDELAAVRASIVPMQRQGTAWDVANAALFLASDEAAFITGVVLAVDGGQAARTG